MIKTTENIYQAGHKPEVCKNIEKIKICNNQYIVRKKILILKKKIHLNLYI